MTANTVLSNSLDVLLKEEYLKVDRTNLELPPTQICDVCQQDLQHSAFDLRKRNNHSKGHKLLSTCRTCRKTHRKVIKGAFIETISKGSLLLSDAAIESLNAQRGLKQKQVIDALIQMAINQDIDAMKLLVGLVQGKSTAYKVEKPLRAEKLPSSEDSAKDMLSKLDKE